MSDIKAKTQSDNKSDPTEPETSFFYLTPSQVEKLAQTAASKAIEDLEKTNKNP